MADNITDSQSSDGYGNTLVAVFDNYSDAKNAADALTAMLHGVTSRLGICA